jgi:hypothetical protein
MTNSKSAELVSGSEIYSEAHSLLKKSRGLTFTHVVEHAGYGAMLSRLMTGLNLALTQKANYYFEIQSHYQIEDLFDISVKQNTGELNQSKKIVWNFMRDTWNVKYPLFSLRWLTKGRDYKERIRASHQFPNCPLTLKNSISRHQWCAVLAQLICGTPTSYLTQILQSKKTALGWRDDALHIGIHVRRGDKNTECPFIPTQIYVNFCNQIIDANPNQFIQIFLTSDDPDSIIEFRRNLPGVQILWDDQEPRFNNYNAEMVAKDKNLANQESITAAKNISLLGQCDYVIGMATAQFTWIGGLLCIFNNDLDTSRQIMIDPITNKRSHWACTYGFSMADVDL